MRRFAIGIDIGGTNIKIGIVNASGSIVCRKILQTKQFFRDKEGLISAVCCSVAHLIVEQKVRRKDIAGVGIGLPGLVNTDKGIVHTLTNIPGWRDVRLAVRMKKELGLPVFIDNDVNVFALGEWKYGAGRGANALICITLGTGVGGGIIINGNVYRGAGYAAGEIGHIPLNERGPRCSCGGFGCLERRVGNRYLLHRARRLFRKKTLSLEDVTRLAASGDARAVRFWQDTAVHIGNALSGVVNLLNPERIVVGGGVAGAFRYLAPGIRSTIQRRALRMPARTVQVVKAKLGTDAGIIGAYVLVQTSLGQN